MARKSTCKTAKKRPMGSSNPRGGQMKKMAAKMKKYS